MPGNHSADSPAHVYSTKRQPWITAEIAELLYPYIGASWRRKASSTTSAAWEDHVHLYLLIGLTRTCRT